MGDRAVTTDAEDSESSENAHRPQKLLRQDAAR